jgi:hypothetical protein
VTALFGDKRSEIIIKLQMLGYEEDKCAFERHLMDSIKKILEDGEKCFGQHKLIAAQYDVHLRHIEPKGAADE